MKSILEGGRAKKTTDNVIKVRMAKIESGHNYCSNSIGCVKWD